MEVVEKIMSGTEETTPSYRVRVVERSGIELDAELEPALEEDMPSRSSPDWTFDWRGFWQNTDFDCEAIIKLSCRGEVFGLVRFGLYPYPFVDNAPQYLEILHLQCVSKPRRSVNPVGFWLLWYAVQICLQYCVGEADGTLIRLDSLEEAIPYYRDKVRMEELGWTTIAPGESGYAFRFTQEGAQEFCLRVEQEYGCPVRLS